MHKYCLLFFLVFLILFNANQVWPEKDYADLIEIIKQDALLIEGNIGFATYNREKLVISVGVAAIHQNSAKSILKARKSSEILAKKNLMQFIHGTKINVQESLESSVTISTSFENGKVTQADRNEREIYIEKIREKGAGMLKDIITLGKWKSADKKSYYYALATKLD